ncbi:MAG: glycosyltransferase family 4 protein [Methanocellales archaeon]|nr:glycosyltransferase family 4 protein [Methanocellales archaeon]
MKILMLCNTLWQNNLGRTLPFYKKVSEVHEVKVIGPLKKGTEIFSPYKGLMEYVPWPHPPTHKMLNFLMQVSKGCDLIHCFKSLPWSYFPSLFLKILRKKPLVLDIDDLDYYPTSLKARFSLPAIGTNMTGLADAIVVQSTKLQEKFGGTQIHTGADTELCNPNVDGSKIKERYNLYDSFTIVNVGTLKRYKGVDIVLEAVRQLNDERIKVFLVGINGATMDRYSENLIKTYKKKLGEQLILAPPQPFLEMPKFLAASDLIVLPHKQDAPWRGFEIPAKLYDAMAMGLAIIVSNVGDLPEIVGDAGIVIPDGDVKACKEAILRLFNDRQLAKKLGAKARERCVEKYSWDVLKKKTLDVYDGVLK